MYSISDALKTAFKTNAKQYCDILVSPTTGDAFHITDASLLSLSFSRQSLSSSSLELGSACCSQLGLTIYNNDGTYDGVTFEGAELFVQIGVKCNDAVSYIPIGYFTVDTQPRMKETITLSCLDRMVLFDNEINATALTSVWTSSLTLKSLVEWCCTTCGVTLQTTITSSFPNYDYHPSAMPDTDGLTYRQLLIWCCELMNRCGYMDWNGQLRLDAYHTTADITIDESWRFSSDLYEKAITITGIELTIDSDSGSSTQLVGNDGYVISLSGNELAQDFSVLDDMDLVNFSYTPFSASTLPMPYLYPMDRISFSKVNRSGSSSTTTLVSLTDFMFTLNGQCDLEGVGLTAQEQGYASLNPFTTREKAIISQAKEEINRVTNTRLQKVLAVNELVANSLGFYTTTEEVSGGQKVYFHDKPLLTDSKNVFTMNAGVFAWTDNYNGTSTVWNSSVEYGGNAMFKKLSAIGLDLSDTSNIYHTEIKPDSFKIFKESTLVMQIYAGAAGDEEVVMAIPKIVVDDPSTDVPDGYLQIGEVRMIPHNETVNGVITCTGMDFVFAG